MVIYEEKRLIIPGGGSGSVINPHDYYESGYTDGFEAGYGSGYTQGYNEGSEGAYDTGFADGLESGLTAGYNSGYTQGLEEGCASCSTVSYESGYNDGYETGYTEGYESGYTEGQSGCQESYADKYFTIEFLSTNTDYLEMPAGTYEMKFVNAFGDQLFDWTTGYCGDLLALPGEIGYGDRLMFRRTAVWAVNLFSGWTAGGATYIVYGNSMSLLYGDDFAGKTAFPAGCTSNALLGLFKDCSGLTGSENLVLPASAMVQSAYQAMFYGCSNMRTAPELPAMTLARDCYNSMFDGCSKLIRIPELPAMTLAPYCYTGMFRECARINSSTQYRTDYVTLSATTLAEGCYANMFENCTGMERAAILAQTTIPSYGCWCMFRGCSYLDTVACHSAGAGGDMCFDAWLENVSQFGAFYKLPSVTDTGQFSIPQNWEIRNIQ